VEAGAAGAESEAGGGAVPGAAGHRERRAVVTVVRGRQGGPETGARMVVYADRVEGTLGDPDLDAAAAADARRMMEEGASQSLLYTYRGGRLDPEAVVRRRRDVLEAGPEHVQVAIQSIVPPPVLLIFGAGHDAIPLARYGHEAGFRVIVVDSRRAYATPERFPEADRVIHAHPDEALDHVTIDRYTYVVVMTHNFNHDRDILRAIWGQPYAYRGGPGPLGPHAPAAASAARPGKASGTSAGTPLPAGPGAWTWTPTWTACTAPSAWTSAPKVPSRSPSPSSPRSWRCGTAGPAASCASARGPSTRCRRRRRRRATSAPACFRRATPVARPSLARTVPERFLRVVVPGAWFAPGASPPGQSRWDGLVIYG